MTLTRDEIMAMSADELRVAIGKREGYSWYESTDCAYFTSGTAILPEGLVEVETPSAPRRHILLPCPDYPHDIAAAWELVVEMAKSGLCPALLNDDNGHWALATDGNHNVLMDEDTYDIQISFFVEKGMWCDTAPLAISRAWLIWSEESEE